MRRREVLTNFLRPEENRRSKKILDPFTLTIHWNLSKACEELNCGIMRDQRRTDPKQMKFATELCNERRFVSIGSVWTARKLVGRSHEVWLQCSKCARPTRRLMNVGPIDRSMVRWFHLEQKWNSILHLQNTKVECFSSLQKSFLVFSWDTPKTRREVGLVILWSWIRRICKQFHHLICMQKKIQIKTRHAGKTAEFCRCVQSGKRPHAGISAKSFGRKRRSPRSRCRNHVAPRTKPYVPKDNFSDTSELHWCPETHENSPWIGVTRFEWLNTDPPEGHMWVSRQTDKETGHYKTWIQVARRMVENVEKNLGAHAAREHRGIHLNRNDDRDYEDKRK